MSKDKKILHIFPESMQLEQFLIYMKEKYPQVEHDFIIIDIGGSGEATRIKEHFYEIFKITNISTFKPTDALVLCKRLRDSKAYDNIIFHSLYLNYLLLALFFNKKAVRRATFIIWGVQDAGPFFVPETKSKYKIAGWFYEKLRSVIIPEFKYIGTVLDADYDKVKKLYGVTAANKKCKYMLGAFNNKEQAEKKNRKHINIQAGHSGYKVTSTLETLDTLSKFKDEDIRIFSPLSYGDEKYIQEVIKKGKEIFGKKFIPITKQMSGTNFIKFISSMDIYIHNALVQMGLANVFTNIAYRSKVYLNAEGAVYDEYTNIWGYTVSKVSDIREQSFEEFIYLCPEEAEKNKLISDYHGDAEDMKAVWDNLLES